MQPFSSPSNLRKHERNKHLNERRPTNVCPVCAKTFVDSAGLKYHQRTHQRTPPTAAVVAVPRRLLLIAANVGSVFDGNGHVKQRWLKRVLQLIRGQQPAFIAVHMQEVGGSSRMKCPSAAGTNFLDLLLRPLAPIGYVCSRFGYDPAHTALASLYLVHNSALDEVQQVDLHSGALVPLSAAPDPSLFAVSPLPVADYRLQTTAAAAIDDHGGYMLSRWVVYET